MNSYGCSQTADALETVSRAAPTSEVEQVYQPVGPLPIYRSGRLRSSKIMIVDDEPSTISVVRRHLQAVGYCDFVTTTIPEKVLNTVRRESPEILILDVMMEEYNGLDILEAIRGDKQLSDLPVIILTAASDGETRKIATALGATDFISKPVDPNELALRVRNVLSIKARQARIAENSQRFALRYVTRQGCEIPVSIVLQPGEERQAIEGKLHDLATGGARLQVPVAVDVAQEMTFEINLSKIDCSVSAKSTVRWVQPSDENWEIGCEFAVDLPEHVFETMADAGYLDRRCEERWRISLDAVLRRELTSDRDVNVLFEDYSPGGIRLFSPQPIKVGERLLLHIRDENERISIPARAMWQIDTDDGYTIGCAFLNKSGYASLVQVVVSTSQEAVAPARQSRPPALTALIWTGTLSILLLWGLTKLGLLSWSWPF